MDSFVLIYSINPVCACLHSCMCMYLSAYGCLHKIMNRDDRLWKEILILGQSKQLNIFIVVKCIFHRLSANRTTFTSTPDGWHHAQNYFQQSLTFWCLHSACSQMVCLCLPYLSKSLDFHAAVENTYFSHFSKKMEGISIRLLHYNKNLYVYLPLSLEICDRNILRI